MSDTTELPFDQYQRYRLVADVLENVRLRGERLRVLDVGGRTGLLRRFLPQDRVDLVDLEASEVSGLVLGDGSRLPFVDRAFDAVVSFDTLEHVPPGRREAFVDECLRVARRWAVIAGPYRSPEVERAEEDLRAFLERKLETRHRYLWEHHAHGLPERGAIEARLARAGARVVSIGHASLARWLPAMCLALYLDRDAPLRSIARRFHRFYNERLYPSDVEEPVYRHAVVAAIGDAPLPDPARVLPAPAVPAASDPALTHLVQELLDFDARRDVVQREWQRLMEVHRGLEKDLAEHAESLATVTAERDAQAATIDALRAQVRELRTGVEALSEELERERAGARETIDVLKRDLDEHRRTLEALRAELEAARAAGRELEQELERVNTAASEINALAVSLDARLGAANAELTSRKKLLRRVCSRRLPPA